MAAPTTSMSWCQVCALFILVVNFLSSVQGELRYVTCGSVLKLQNTEHGVRLHSHDIKYGSGSGQQSVTGHRPDGRQQQPLGAQGQARWQLPEGGARSRVGSDGAPRAPDDTQRTCTATNFVSPLSKQPGDTAPLGTPARETQGTTGRWCAARTSGSGGPRCASSTSTPTCGCAPPARRTGAPSGARWRSAAWATQPAPATGRAPRAST
uniref:Putative secreted stromal cell-derived factor 2 n=1 Tax=Ixodes ricinus TaxID=34613 RepID=V5HAV7_IXORI